MACVVAGGHAWLAGGCVVGGGQVRLQGGMCSCRGCVWLWGGMRGCPGGVHGCWGACVGNDEIRSMSGQYASYWNAFLCEIVFGWGQT